MEFTILGAMNWGGMNWGGLIAGVQLCDNSTMRLSDSHSIEEFIVKKSRQGDRKRAVAALAPRARPIEARNRFDGLQNKDDDDDDDEGTSIVAPPVKIAESVPGFKRPRRTLKFLKTSNCACHSDNYCGHSHFQSDEPAVGHLPNRSPISPHFEQFYSSFVEETGVIDAVSQHSFDAHFLGNDSRLGPFPAPPKSVEQNSFDHNFPELNVCPKPGTTNNSKVENSESKPPYGGLVCPVMTTDQSFQNEAERIRAMCMAERLELESRPSGKLAPLLVTEKPMPDSGALCRVFDGCEINEIGMTHSGWQVLSVAIDSGAAETVIPHRLVAQHPVRATQSSKNGMCYASATGQPIPNLGEQCLPLITQEGTLRGMTFQAAPVSKALGSVKRMCSSGHRVVFDEDGSYVENKTTGEINWLREEAGNYMLDLWVIPPEEMPANAGFGRQS